MQYRISLDRNDNRISIKVIETADVLTQSRSRVGYARQRIQVIAFIFPKWVPQSKKKRKTKTFVLYTGWKWDIRSLWCSLIYELCSQEKYQTYFFYSSQIRWWNSIEFSNYDTGFAFGRHKLQFESGINRYGSYLLLQPGIGQFSANSQ